MTAWVADYAPSMGAALSYHSLFSLALQLLIVFSIAGLVFGQDAVRGQVFLQLQGLPGPDAARTIEDLLVSVSKPAEGVTSTAISVLLLLVGATSVFGEFQDALDRIWRAPRAGPFGWPVGAGARPLAVLRHDPEHRLRARRVAGVWRRGGRNGQAVGGHVPNDLQDFAARVGEVARCLAGRDRDFAAVYGEAFSDRDLNRHEQSGVGFRRGRLADRNRGLNLLLRASFPARRGAHADLSQDVRLDARPATAPFGQVRHTRPAHRHQPGCATRS